MVAASGGVFCVAVASCLNMPNARVGIPGVPPQYSIAATDLPKYAAMFDAVGLLICAIGAFYYDNAWTSTVPFCCI